MRAIPALAASTLALLSAVSVAAAQDDRYDPPRPSAVGEEAVSGVQVASVAYKGPFLTWAGKASAAAPAPIAPVSPPAVAPLAAAPAAFAPPPAHMPPVTAELAPPPPPLPAAPPPSVQVMTAPPAPAQAASAPPAAQASVTTQGARFYSLHRDYGLTPDPDPAPTDRPLVLVGPPTGQLNGGAGASDAGASDDSDSTRSGQQGGASDNGGE